MCGRFNNHLPKMHGWTDVLSDWSLNVEGVWESYNKAPSTQIAVITVENGELSKVHDMRWGMIPQWSKVFESRYATFNARAESVAEKATFRNAWKHAQRCIIPMAGYYEWRKVESLEPGSSKQPVYISDPNMGLMLAAGLYEPWGNKGLLSSTMLTKPASSELADIHPRMPVLLTPESLNTWLNEPNTLLEPWLLDTPQPDLVYWPVSSAVGNVKNDSEQLIQAIDT